MLPKFKSLSVVKTVQSIAGNGTSSGFDTRFDALDYMKSEVDKCEYDVAIIRCGAYGMDLAALVKRTHHIALHMA